MKIVIDAGVIAKAFDGKKATYFELISSIPKAFAEINSKLQEISFALRSQVFISYRRKDTEMVNDVVEELNKQDLRLWIDRENIPVGEAWYKAIEKAIHDSGFFLACLSSKSLPLKKRKILKKEIEMALFCRDTRGLIVIPVLLEECNIPRKLKSLHYYEWYKKDGRANLLKRIEEEIEYSKAYKISFDGYDRFNSKVFEKYGQSVSNHEAYEHWCLEIHRKQVFDFCGKRRIDLHYVYPDHLGVESCRVFIGVALTTEGVLIVEEELIEKLQELTSNQNLRVWGTKRLNQHLSDKSPHIASERNK